MDYKEIIVILEAIKGNVWLMTFALLWVFGWYLKEHTPLNNKLIPTFILLAGALMGFFIISKSITGIGLGLIMAFLITAFYDYIKNTIEYVVVKRTKELD